MIYDGDLETEYMDTITTQILHNHLLAKRLLNKLPSCAWR